MTKRLTLKQAVRIACEAIDSERQRLAVNANLYEVYEMESGRGAWERRQKLQAARQVLADLAERGPGQLGLWDDSRPK